MTKYSNPSFIVGALPSKAYRDNWERIFAPKEKPPCDHGVTFDKATADTEKLPAEEIRKRWPRLYGPCPKGCGFDGIAYASDAHFIYGDW